MNTSRAYLINNKRDLLYKLACLVDLTPFAILILHLGLTILERISIRIVERNRH